MGWDSYDKIRDIVRESGMSTRPEFYSGRGAIVCDLSGKHLEKIYQGILKEFGEDSAAAFIQMVKDIKVLSATKFLNSLYSLCNNNWIWDIGNEGDNISFDGIGSALGTLGSSLFSGNRDETPAIKNDFLKNHGVKPEVTRNRDNYGYYYNK